MSRISQVEPLVEKALIENPKSRGDNFILYAEVLKNYIPLTISFGAVCFGHVGLKIPALETITRCRRKLQEKHPEYRDEKAQAIRSEEEKEFVDYAKE